jgi:hypothetical protein
MIKGMKGKKYFSSILVQIIEISAPSCWLLVVKYLFHLVAVQPLLCKLKKGSSYYAGY